MASFQQQGSRGKNVTTSEQRLLPSVAGRALQRRGVQLGTAWCFARPIWEYYLSLHPFFCVFFFRIQLTHGSTRSLSFVWDPTGWMGYAIVSRSSSIRANERGHFLPFRWQHELHLCSTTINSYWLVFILETDLSEKYRGGGGKETSACLSLVRSEDVNNKPN